MHISKAQIEAVKQTSDIISIIKSKGIKLKKKGKNYVGLCPFHKEKTPSFTVDPVKQLYNCFGCPPNGSDSTGGDVIRFTVKIDNISFSEAVIKLSKSSIKTKGSKSQVTNSRSKVTNKKQKPATRNMQSAALPPQLQKLLNRVIEYYQADLSRDIRGLNYLQKKRGIQEKQSILDFGAGFVSGNLLQVIPSDGEVIDNLKTIGILNNKGNELFYGSVVFPLLDHNKNVVSVYGRRIDNNGVKHLYLPGKKQGIINHQAAKRSKSLILTESVIDALSLYDAGFKNTIPCYGINGLTDDHLSLFSRHITKEVYICFDSDDAGKTAAKSLSDQLEEKNINVYTISLSDADSNIKDANDYFKNHTPKEFQELLKSANPNSTQRSQHVADRQETFFKKTDHGFIITYRNRQYEIKGIAKQGTQLKATIKANNINSKNASRFELSTIDMYSSRSREYFTKLCSSFFNESEELIKEDLNRLLERMEQYIKNHETSDKKQEITITPEDRQTAMKFLKNPDMFDELLSDFDTIGHVGEDTNKLVCYLACVSRKLDTPLSILIQSRSGAGKSSLQDASLSLMPEEDYVKYTRLTDNALYYKDENSLVHKILAIEEIAGAGGAAYSIRSLQSSGGLRLAYTIKDPVTGKMKAEEKKVNGPTPLFSTASDIEIDPDMANRCIILSIDESRAMTSMILKRQREEYTIQGYKRKILSQQIIKKHQTAQRLLKPFVILNPFAQEMGFSPDLMRARRDQRKYLIIINAICLLHQHQRKIKTMKIGSKNIEFIEIHIKDIAIANKIANEVLGISLDEMCPQAKKLSALIHEMVGAGKAAKIEKGVYGFIRRQLREYTGWSDWQIKTYLRQLEELEFVYARQGKKGKEYIYEINYNGQGKDGKKFYLGLVDVEKLKKKYPDKE